MITLLLGIGSSIVAEIIVWLNQKLSGTVLKGDGAFILAAFVALVGSIIKLYLVPTADFQAFLVSFSAIWATSQVIFIGVIQLFSLDVKSAPSPML